MALRLHLKTSQAQAQALTNQHPPVMATRPASAPLPAMMRSHTTCAQAVQPECTGSPYCFKVEISATRNHLHPKAGPPLPPLRPGM